MTGPPVPPTPESLADLSTDGYYALATTPGESSWEDRLADFESLRDLSGHLITTMESELEALGSHWSGGSGAVFAQRCEAILGALQQFHSDVSANCDGMRDIGEQMSNLRSEADLLIDEDDGWCDNLNDDDDVTIDNMREDLRKELRDKVVEAYQSMATVASGYFLRPPEPVAQTLAAQTVSGSSVSEVSITAQDVAPAADTSTDTAASAQPEPVVAEENSAPGDTSSESRGGDAPTRTGDGTENSGGVEGDSAAGDGPMLQSMVVDPGESGGVESADGTETEGSPALQSAALSESGPGMERAGADPSGAMRGMSSGSGAPSAAAMGGAGGSSAFSSAPTQPTPSDTDYAENAGYSTDDETADDSADGSGDDGDACSVDENRTEGMDPFGVDLDMSVGDGALSGDLPSQDEPDLETVEPKGPKTDGNFLEGLSTDDGRDGGDASAGSGSRLEGSIGAGLAGGLGGAAAPDAGGGPAGARSPEAEQSREEQEMQRRSQALRDDHRG